MLGLRPASTLRVATAVALLLISRGAHAHGSRPELTSVTFGADPKRTLALASNFGVLVTGDGGERWELICEEAIGYRSGQPAFPAFLPNDGLVIAAFDGLVVSRDGGCSFAAVADLKDRALSDLAQNPTDPNILYVATAKRGGSNTLYRSDDGAGSFLPTALTRDRLLSAVRVAPTQPKRVYVSAWLDDVTPTVLRSDDEGASWDEHAHPLVNTLSTQLHLLAVSPSNPDVVFTRTFSELGNSVWRSDDGAKTFSRVVDSLDTITAFAVAPDNKVVWMTTTYGVYKSNDGGKSFTPPDKYDPRACAAFADGALFACGDSRSDGWTFARTSDLLAPWQPLLARFEAIASMRTCAATAPTTKACADPWLSLQAQFGFGSAYDGGAAPDARATTPDARQDFHPDAAAADAPTPVADVATKPTRGKSGCALAGAADTQSGAVWLALALVMFLRTRPRR